jgi:hypothetical protein
MEHQDQPEQSHRIYPILLHLRCKDILPTYLEYMPPRLKAYQEDKYQRGSENSLDHVAEAQDVVILHSVRCQQSLQ